MDLGELYQAHVDRLQSEYATFMENHGIDAVIVHSGSAVPQSRFDDQDWPHKPTPTFAHWLPLRAPDAFLVIRPESHTLHCTPNTSYWESPAPVSSDHFWDAFQVREDGLEGARAAAGPRTVFIGEAAETAASLGIAEDRVNPANLLTDLDACRALKSDYERHCVGTANSLAARGHQAVAAAFEAGDESELALHLAYLAATKQDAWETPYGNIVALGEHAGVLHHVHYGKRATGAHSLLVDAGATYQGYASDITRTYVKGSGPGVDTFAALLRRVETMQQQLCTELRPGLPYEELHERAHQGLAAALRDLDIIGCNPEEMVDSGATRLLFPHGLGHSLGIQVHDVGCKPMPPSERNPHLRTTATVREGHIFTIEPGCYFIPSLLDQLRESSIAGAVNWDLVDVMRPLGGIRIEDNVAVMADESVNLTRDNWSG